MKVATNDDFCQGNVGMTYRTISVASTGQRTLQEKCARSLKLPIIGRGRGAWKGKMQEKEWQADTRSWCVGCINKSKS